MREPITMEVLQTLVFLARETFGTKDLIIAGGAPRDVLSGVEVKDIDFFVQCTDEQVAYSKPGVKGDNTESVFTLACRVFAGCIACTQEPVFVEGAEEYGGLADLCNIESRDWGPVQIVALRDVCPIDDIADYDFGLSQVFVTPRDVFQSLQAVADRAARVIRYTQDPLIAGDAKTLRAVKRLARLRTKYTLANGWTYDVAVLDEYEKDTSLIGADPDVEL